MKFPAFITAAAASALIVGSTALAQQSPEPAQPQRVASQCLEDLQAFGNRMNEEGYWLTGWGGRWGYGVDPTTPPPAAPDASAAPETVAPGTETAEPEQPGAAGVQPGPWGDPRFGMNSPSFQIRTLYAGANILAVRGDQEACNVVLSELTDVYEDYVQQLQQAGVEPGEVEGWRQEMLLAARPVKELQRGAINIADVTGTEIRNTKDEQLGTVDDVLLDAEDGSIRYVVVSRGGFLGIGEEFVVVPWRALQATPGLNTFVLNVSEEVMEQAPKVDPDQFANPGVFARQRDEIDQYWQKTMGG